MVQRDYLYANQEFNFDNLNWKKLKCGDEITKDYIIKTKDKSLIEIEFQSEILNPLLIGNKTKAKYFSKVIGENTFFILREDFFREDVNNSSGKIITLEGSVYGAKINNNLRNIYQTTIEITITSIWRKLLVSSFIEDKPGRIYDIPSCNGYILYSCTKDHPWLGLILGEPTSGGIIVRDVVVGGPSYWAGIKSGDEIIEIGGKKITEFEKIPYSLSVKINGKEI